MRIILFSFAILFLMSINLFAQNSSDSLTYTMPKELILEDYEDYKEHYEINYKVIASKFYPIGWSKDGNFAYISLFDDYGDACNCISVKFIIMNTLTDEILWEHNTSPEDYVSYTPFKIIWEDNIAIFSKKLREFNIIQEELECFYFPIHFNGDTLDYDIKRLITDREQGIKEIKNITLSIKSKIKGEKVIYKAEDVWAMDVWVSEYLKSPYENRIVIILTKHCRGWEGPPLTMSFNIIGCHLEKGNFVKTNDIEN